MIVEAVMVNALDTYLTEDEEMEIAEVFAMISDSVVRDGEALENPFSLIYCRAPLPRDARNTKGTRGTPE
jgi:hypothetical protein